jgi:hypothetical protein
MARLIHATLTPLYRAVLMSLLCDRFGRAEVTRLKVTDIAPNAW